MTTRETRVECAFRSIKEIASDLDPSDEYYFKACVQEYFKMKGLNLQAQRGDCTGRNEGAMVVLCLLKEIRLSVIIVMRK